MLDKAGVAAPGLPETESDKPAKKTFKAYLIGHLHIDIAEVRAEASSISSQRSIGLRSCLSGAA